MYGRQEFGLVKRRMKDGRPIYYYWIYDENLKRIYRSTGKRTKAEAMKYVMERRDSNQLGKMDKVNISMNSFCRDLFVWDKCPIISNILSRGRHYTKATAAVRRGILVNHILPFLGSVPVSRLTAARVDEWLLSLPKAHNLSNSSSNKVLEVLKEVMEYAVRCGVAKENPCASVERLGDDSKRHESFTRDEVRAIIGEESDWENPFVRLMCKTAALTGMRIGEVRALMADQIDDHIIRVNASMSEHDGRKCTKNGKERVVPIPDSLKAELLRYAPVNGGYIFSADSVNPISVPIINRCLKKRCETLSIPVKTFHSFRAFFNTALTTSNINESVIRSIVGHQSADMTEHYLHLEAGDLSMIDEVQKSIIG